MAEVSWQGVPKSYSTRIECLAVYAAVLQFVFGFVSSGVDQGWVRPNPRSIGIHLVSDRASRLAVLQSFNVRHVAWIV